MQVVILCGGKGTRLKTNEDIPKPLALVNEKPLIWHIMKIYSKFGFNEFILPLGYKGDKIKEYFMHYDWMNHDFMKIGSENRIELLEEHEKWNITFVNTGLETMTGGRIKKIEKYIKEDTFMLTYGDGLADIDIDDLINFHMYKGNIATVTGVERKTQYGVLSVKDGIAESFNEKTSLDGLINGGFFVLDKKVFDYLSEDDECIWENEPLSRLANDGELAVYEHKGIWMAIDTYKDLIEANQKWNM
ncbi:MAG TPA: glucose-1-phosphate cytidylyltransferase [Clostridiales bacterium]|nr:MAG: glucose-1-phosphate cytidylyltransferase [Clostridiales bacterium GWD2_32_19]HCC08180.1 glucose-1-phosphate cytidylyltransferase [Clostridiales bacterium]